MKITFIFPVSFVQPQLEGPSRYLFARLQLPLDDSDLLTSKRRRYDSYQTHHHHD